MRLKSPKFKNSASAFKHFKSKTKYQGLKFEMGEVDFHFFTIAVLPVAFLL